MIAQHSSAAPRVDLAEANNSSWAARNPDRPVLASREPLTTAQKARAKAQRASRKITSQQRKEAEDMLNSAIQQMLAEEAQKVNDIALEHGVTVEKVKKLMGGIKNYKSSRSAQLENALMHVKAEQVNKDLPRGAKFGAKDLRMLVKEDTAMQNLTEGEKQQYIDNLIEHRAMQNMSVRATNASAARDVQSTLDNVFKMLDSLAVRTGIYACVFASRGHVYDTAQATWFGTDNVMDFWEDVLQMEADEIARKLEQWACMAGRSLDERETVQNMQRVCTRLLNSGLSTCFVSRTHSILTNFLSETVAKRRDIRINYASFDTAIKEKLGIDLRGWPEGIPFQSPTSLNDLNSLLKVRCALKDGSCHWFRMSPRQREEYNALLDARRKKGEVVTKPRKKRSDAGVPRKRKGKENSHQRKRARAPGSSMQAPKSAEFVCTSEEESSEDEA
ncbi:uncharacterized protein HD556DRAFT_1236368 [Suillus plorans]|uniref:Uncharacterized protein n=1 Tax=Suillus plorans TaxID=116603 RepID=A0A9P7DFK7_9AGAM|nr:uncharacterized protein HD556DRAFT_1249292 [Suillus plorans]XP_041157549.1 uncharacterized protein HD556DRAFT_1242234 [Suillus plorans]XP_041160963.1 uncharacterized protein HD556DRAFT_1236368 [Suillus plorans]KAG1785813.1 hypothetical protein HD556DRAFT_1249292 [Suillus plorans]KAG1790587.1 hypothetical protein HD556DRAFT_1242234 [Suillus plorans]KAG1794924.1 hypothetical protein HD556DRAFT_1236368 [Suillus plorans]